MSKSYFKKINNSPLENKKRGIKRIDEEDFKREEELGISLDGYKFKTKRDRRKLINNCCEPEIGLHILKESMKEIPKLF